MRRITASKVSYPIIRCGTYRSGDPRTLTPVDFPINFDPQGSPAEFGTDGIFRCGNLETPWMCQVGNQGLCRGGNLDYKSRVVRATKILNPPAIEKQRWRIVQHHRELRAECHRVHRQIWEAGPVCGVANTHEGPQYLVSHPNQEGGISLTGSPRGDEVTRNDLAVAFFTSQNRYFRAAAALVVADDALLLSLLRHLPDLPKRDAQAKVEVNGRTYWLREYEREWVWLSVPEEESIQLSFFN